MSAAPQQFTLVQLETTILTDIVNQFANSNQSTTRWSVLVKFEGQPAPAAINTLLSRNFILRHGTSSGEESYLPNAVAFHFCANSELRNRAKLATTIVLHTLKQMFKRGRGKEGFTFEDLKQQVEHIYPNRIFDGSTLKLGLYLAKDFGVFQGVQFNAPEDTEVVRFHIGEGAISMSDPDGEWDRVMAQYKPYGQSGLLETVGLGSVESTGNRWERVKDLGSGGQSDVFLVRRPERSTERRYYAGKLQNALKRSDTSEFAEAAWSYARPEEEGELAALKVFKIPPEGAGMTPPPGSEEYEAIKRLENEITVLKQGRPGLPRLLDSNLKERWIVTEYLSGKTLKDRPLTFKAKPAVALKAFRSLVYTVATLHKDGYVHRDIKPANVFIKADDELVLGDFGIVYLSADDRITQIDERVGPRDYMPPWAHQGKRIDQVEPNWDVYMLGKLLWCMVDGRSFLPREDFDEADFDLTKTFPNDRNMQIINNVLKKCLVKKSQDCLPSAQQLLALIDDCLDLVERGMPLLNENGQIAVPCRICGKGFYREHIPGGYTQVQTLDARNMPTNAVRLRLFVCDVCFHYEFFAPGFPDEAVKRGWRP